MNAVLTFIRDSVMICAFWYVFATPGILLYDLPKLLMSISMVGMVPIIGYDVYRLVDYISLKVSDMRDERGDQHNKTSSGICAC